jgi:tetratricopeptide (TPR) repeat protein
MRNVIAIVGLAAMAAGPVSAQDTRTLVPNLAVRREIAGGTVHHYEIAMEAGQYTQIAVEQQGIDLLLVSFGSAGPPIEMDRAEGSIGFEKISVIADRSATYQLFVRPLNTAAATGRYEIKISEVRPGAAGDAIQVAAERAFALGRKLHREGTPDSWRTALDHYTQALPLWQTAADRTSEATTLHNLGELHKSLGQPQQAIEYYAQALAIRRAVESRHGEAATLADLGEVYDLLDERERALEYFHQALPLWRAVGDQQGEVGTVNSIGVIYAALGEYQSALGHHREALPLRRALGDRAGEARTLNNLGLVYSLLKDNEKALDHYRRSLEIRRALGDRRSESVALNNIAAVYDELGDHTKALATTANRWRSSEPSAISAARRRRSTTLARLTARSARSGRL